MIIAAAPGTMPRGVVMTMDTEMAALSEDLVLFDIGGVQLELDYGRFFAEAAKGTGKTPDQFKIEYIESGIENAIMAGGEAAAYFNGMRKILRKDLSDEELMDLIGYAWKRQVNDVLEVKDDVMNAGYLVANFSNISETAREILAGRHRRIFQSDVTSHPGIYSYEVGAIKPHPPMYEEAAGYGVTLVDDNEAYVRAGVEGFGWNGILFTPYIDRLEAVRASENYGHSSARIEVANSVEELVEALKKFEIDI